MASLRFSETSNRDGSVTVYVSGKKAFRGSRAEADEYREQRRREEEEREERDGEQAHAEA